ncbi:hypothetical protein VTG60DRAFT_5805 [Thermothelomyces hinnuleus]
MESLFKVDGENVQLTLQRLIEESISQRVTRWKTKQEKIPDRELAAQIIAMCWSHDALPSAGPGCLMPDTKGGYVYVPYDETNGPIVRKMDKLLEKEVNEKCFWEFLDGDNASRIDFHGKIKILARYRLMQTGVDVSDNDPQHPQFRFGIVNITEFGSVNMKLYNMDWNCTESEVTDSLEAYSNPLFNRDAVRGRLLKDLATIYHPRDAVEEAEVLYEELKSRQPTMNEAD